MILISLPINLGDWKSVSFASTLYLSPILDLLLSHVPKQIHPEVRLGLQEALVNAAKHGNQLDPTKKVKVKFCYRPGNYSWIVCDQGEGFLTEYECTCPLDDVDLPPEDAEHGRGLCILEQIFDRVSWSNQGTKVELFKQVEDLPLSSRILK